MNDTPPFWNIAAMAAGAGRVWAIVVAPPRPVLAFSDDASQTWRDVALPSLTGPFNIGVHPSDRSAFFLGAGAGFFVTRDIGETWSQRQFSSIVLGVAVEKAAFPWTA